MRNKIRTYSRAKEYQTFKNDKFEETMQEDGDAFSRDKQSITELYSETIEHCKQSFSMGNQQDREHLILTNEQKEDDKQWTTVETFTKSQIGLQTPLNSVKPSSLLKTRKIIPLKKPSAQPKRWSESRKVQDSQANFTATTGGLKKKGSKLKHFTKTLINIYEDKTSPQKGKLNSTVCKGGSTLCQNIIDGFSPIKEKVFRKTPRKPMVRQNLRSRVVTVTPASIGKLEKPITSQEKVKKWLQTSPVNLPDHERSCKNLESLQEEHFEGEDIEREPSEKSAEDSSIPCAGFVAQENEENSVSKMTSIKQRTVNDKHRSNNSASVGRPKRVTRKKRKRICMPANWRGKLSPQEKIPKTRGRNKNNKVLHGKELKLENNMLSHRAIKVKVKECGNLTFDQCPYKLRSRTSVFWEPKILDNLKKQEEVEKPKDILGKEMENPPVLTNGSSTCEENNDTLDESTLESEKEQETEIAETENKISVTKDQIAETEDKIAEAEDQIIELPKKRDDSLVKNDESPPNMELSNLTHTKRKLSFAPKRLLTNMTASEEERNPPESIKIVETPTVKIAQHFPSQNTSTKDANYDSVSIESDCSSHEKSSIDCSEYHSLGSDDVIKDSIAVLEKASPVRAENQDFNNNENLLKRVDESGRSTCVLQRTRSDSGVRMSSFACDSKSAVSDFLQTTF